MKPNEGSGTLEVILVLLLLSSFISGYALYLMTSRHITAKYLKDSSSSNLFMTLGEISALLEKDKDIPDSPTDSIYTYTKEGFKVEVEELSSRINPNWIYVHVLAETPLSKLCLSAEKPLTLQQYRIDHGFSVNIAKHYNDFFTKEAFEKFLTPYGYVNLNNDDEFAIEKAIIEAGGENAFAAYIHSIIRQKRESRELINRVELEQLLTSQRKKLADIIGIEPQWNVNHADSFLITSLISYEPFNIKNAVTVATSIIAAREAKPITQIQLIDLTGLNPNHRLFTWLGTRSWFWSVTISSGGKTLHAILARSLSQTDKTTGFNKVIPITWEVKNQ